MAAAVQHERSAGVSLGAVSPWVPTLCWLAVLLDGYDLVVLGAVIPSLLDYPKWGLDTAALSLISTIGLVGMTVGALATGTIDIRRGRGALALAEPHAEADEIETSRRSP